MTFTPQRTNIPTAQVGPSETSSVDTQINWLKLAQDAYADSTSYIDENYRQIWDDSIRAFNSEHPADSKYNAPSYSKRSRLYRPKIRSVIRKNEAAAASAYFSNMDVTSVSSVDPDSKLGLASASLMQSLLQQRLTKSIPWFSITIGGLQDAQTTGAACAHIYWEFDIGAPEIESMSITPDEKRNKLTVEGIAKIKPKIDRPVIDLIPVENLRFDPGADWTDPVNSSPYIIHLIPMYIQDIVDKMEKGQWKSLPLSVIMAAGSNELDSTRNARNKGQEDPYQNGNKSVSSYEIVWVQRHIHRHAGEDFEFYTIGDQALLTNPTPLRETVFHGIRPYVIGKCILETHKVIPSPLPVLGRGLQDEANEIANQRIDNIKFVLNKKWFVKRGRNVDINGLMRNVPGGAVAMDDPNEDVKEISWPDVTASAYEEQSRIDNDMNELLGNFSAAQVVADHGINGPAHNMAMLGQSAGTLVEYLLRTYTETFIQPVLRQLILLEQHYETDKTILAISAKNAKLWQRFGISDVTDELLEQELLLTVNVGMGATDPQLKLQKFLVAMNSFAQLMKGGIPGINLQEVGKEIFGHLGYSDGSRFFTNEDPQVAMMQQQIQQLNGVIQQLQAKVQDKQTAHAVKLQAAKLQADTQVQTTQMKEDNANLRNSVTHLTALRLAEAQRNHETMLPVINHQLEQTNLVHDKVA